MSSSPFREKDFSFSMPFGTRIVSEDGVVFRLWAPGAQEVDLCLTAGSGAMHTLPMTAGPDGWFTLHHHGARAGDLYQFRIDGGLMVPDPVSRYQAADVHGPSVICNPHEYHWSDQDWQGRPWEEAVIYELHIGAFSAQGTFDGVRERLDYLAGLGVTAIELMPVSQFPGSCNWGYDGALLFAPCNCYGSPEDFKNLVQAAHQRGLMVFLDVVYNHFGPEGNYLYVYAREEFFTERFHTPWGAAVRFSGPRSRVVRDFFIANALFWLEEYHLDGLRFDAVHAIFDPSQPDILEEIARAVRHGPGLSRHVHLILENDNNCSRYLNRDGDGSPRLFTAQWNDDVHHACHVLLTGETEGYYRDYSDSPIQHLARCLTEGFAYQGEISTFRGGKARGEPSAHLSPLAFVSFLQNHDQIGNRALGERLPTLCDPRDLHICLALILLAPSPPLLFMGEEFGATTPFYYFCDFGADLAENVTAGRREEFSAFKGFTTPEGRERIPDPNAEATFLQSKLDWSCLDNEEHRAFLALYRDLLQLRHREIVPCLGAVTQIQAGHHVLAEKSLRVWWRLADGSRLSVLLNFHDHGLHIRDPMAPEDVIFRVVAEDPLSFPAGYLPPKSIFWYLEKRGGRDA